MLQWIELETAVESHAYPNVYMEMGTCKGVGSLCRHGLVYTHISPLCEFTNGTTPQ